MKFRRIFCLMALGTMLFGTAAKADEGMWMIHGINKALEKQMKQRGLELSADEIYNADAPGTTVSDAIVALDFGCTGSVISDQGLVITNHHCAYSDVHALSTPEKNYLEDGFWAMTRAEEVPIPGKNIFFLKRVLDLTDEVNETIASEEKKNGIRPSLRKLSYLLEKKYKAETGYEASLASMWGGEKYYMMIYEMFSDIRLVAAPPVTMAAFGGDIDNWEWPQHKCDFAMYRVYTSPEGKPAAYSEKNVPLKPSRKLSISTEGYRPGDFSMVIGFPGRTNRYSSSAETAFEEKITLPISNRLRARNMEIMNSWMNRDTDLRLLYSDRYFTLSNIQELNSGKARNIRRFDVIGKKEAEEAALQTWIDADPERKARWGEVIPMLKKKYQDIGEIETDITYYREALFLGSYISRVVNRITSLKHEVFNDCGVKRRTIFDTEGPDSTELRCCRNHRFCAKKYKAVTQLMLREMEKLDMRVEKDLFVNAVYEYLSHFSASRLGDFQKELIAKHTAPDGKCDYQEIAEEIWNNSFLTDKERLETFLSGRHTLDEYTADPMFRYYQDVRIYDLNMESSALEGEPDLLSLNKEYTHALYEKSLEEGLPQYPNANSTMRITYGTVGGLEPSDAISCSWKTTTQGLLDKYDPSAYEYRMNARQEELLRSGEWGPWGAGKKGKTSMFVNFLTDNDITGGNSGSPVLNGKGEIIGLAFDGNKESLASDVYFVEGYTKCVCVDIRYVLWTLDRYAGMDRILHEIGF